MNDEIDRLRKEYEESDEGKARNEKINQEVFAFTTLMNAEIEAKQDLYKENEIEINKLREMIEEGVIIGIPRYKFEKAYERIENRTKLNKELEWVNRIDKKPKENSQKINLSDFK